MRLWAAELAVKTHANNEEIVNEAAIIAEDLGEWESAALALEVLIEMHEMDGKEIPVALKQDYKPQNHLVKF